MAENRYELNWEIGNGMNPKIILGGINTMETNERYELNKQLAISFHPELDNDNRLHQYFVQMISSSLNKEK